MGAVRQGPGGRRREELLKIAHEHCNTTAFGAQPDPKDKRVLLLPELKRLVRATTAPKSPTFQCPGVREAPASS